jgi:formiminotetrahydrofolate cyclodeaminase
MPDSIWTATLAAFRDRLASLEPAPAGVSTAAVSAIFGLGLLTKVLLVASRRKDYAGDRELVGNLLDDARNKSELLSQLADEDIEAFHQYLDCVRQKKPIDAAIREAIEVPLQVARTAASGRDLCEAATGLIHAVVAPDLGTAAAMLTAAVQSTLLTVKSNLQQLPDGDPYRVEVTAELTRLSLRFRADR